MSHQGWPSASPSPRRGQPQHPWGQPQYSWNQARRSWNQPQQVWQHQWAQRPAMSSAKIALLVLAGIVFLLVVAALAGWSSRHAEPTEPREPPSRFVEETPSVAPEPEPTRPARVNHGLPQRQWPDIPPPNSDDPAWVTLQRSPLYDAALPTLTECPEPDLAETLDELEEQASGQMKCIQQAWRPVLEDLGLADHEIPVYFYSGRTVETPCGQAAAPALYCSAQGGGIYFGEDVLNGASFHEHAVKEVAGHEYGHHLQAMAGFFEAEYRIDQGNEGTRRLELQATCWGYAMLAHDESVELTPEVFETFEPFLRLTIEDGVHGSHDSLVYWGIRGLYSTTAGNCNTWTSSPEDVD